MNKLYMLVNTSGHGGGQKLLVKVVLNPHFKVS